MKKVINIICYVLSALFVLTSIFGIIYFTKQKHDEQSIDLPTATDILTNYGIPVMEMNGDIKDISKENKVNVEVKYTSDELNFNSNATLKWQGASSLLYDKKNYTINFVTEDGEKNKITIKPEWGAQNKYCLKANYIDFSHARNVVSAKLYGDIVHSREKSDKLDTLVNGGAIDGFPIVIFINDEYQGIYTFNTPKDKWILGMGKEEKSAILMADAWTESTRLKEEMSNDFVTSGWELEYCSTEDDAAGTDWVSDSFNDLIKFINENDGEIFKNNIEKYVDLDRTIDTMLFTLMINGQENMSKNILWLTYDGKTWVPSAYDLDSTWGIFWHGNLHKDTDWLTLENFKQNNNTNLLWKKVLLNYEQVVKDRYFELRNECMSFENISNKFASFTANIPVHLYNYESILYPDIPSQKTNNISQILYFAAQNLKRLDAEFLAL